MTDLPAPFLARDRVVWITPEAVSVYRLGVDPFPCDVAMDTGQTFRCSEPADVDGSGAVDVQDYLLFMELYSRGLIDYDGSGRVDHDDFLSFLAAYGAGIEP